MMEKKNGGELDRANLSHAVNTLGAAYRALATIQGYERVTEEVEQCLEFITAELRIIRERERARETK